MRLKYLGHASFQIQSMDTVLLTDPYLGGAPSTDIAADKIEANVILVSHGHSDHVGEAATIAKRTGAAVVTTPEVGRAFFEGNGIALQPGNIGGSVTVSGWRVKFLPATHSCGVAGGTCCGFLITKEERKLYFAGDTGLMMDMSLLQREQVDVAMLPIGGTYTMDPEDALRAVDMIQPKRVVPMHYNTWPVIAQDGGAFCLRAKELCGVEGIALRPGEMLEF